MTAPLSPALAQRIVDQLAPRLELNVNVMDTAGIIIASADPARIGAFHAGAREAAATGAPAVIHRVPAHGGERPGVNLALVREDRIVGVVGVTGDPATVAPVAQVLVTTIGLLLDRETELGSAARREAADRDLLARLVNGPVPAADALPGRGPWRLSLALRPAGTGDPGGAPEPAAVDRFLAGAREDRGLLRARFQGGLWCLAAADATEAPERLRARAERAGLVVLLASPSADPARLHARARMLAALAGQPGLLPAGGAVLPLTELGAEIAAAHLPAVVAEEIAAIAAPLTPPLRRCLAALLAAGGSPTGAARLLGDHRNTVLGRLAQVGERTGLDPREPGAATTLGLALALLRAREVPPAASARPRAGALPPSGETPRKHR